MSEQRPSYMAGQQDLVRWIEACCERDPRAVESVSRLYDSLTAWVSQNPLGVAWYTGRSKKLMTQLLGRMGYLRARRQNERVIVGLRVRG